MIRGVHTLFYTAIHFVMPGNVRVELYQPGYTKHSKGGGGAR